MGQPHTAERGAALEIVLAAYFELHQYSVEANVVIEGRSGNAHELDVVARRTDELTEYVTVMEAKSWEARVGKDVVAKLAYVLADVGMHKGIIAAPGGFTSGALTAAGALGIELWDGAELERRLGAATMADAAGGRGSPRPQSTVTILGAHHHLSATAVVSTLKRAARGRFGLAAESVVWQAALWLPVRCVAFRVAGDAPTKRRRVRGSTTSTWVQEVHYDGFAGTLLDAVGPCEERLNVPGRSALTPLVSAADITRPVRKAMTALDRVSTPAAMDRHRNTLDLAGLPADAESVTVEGDVLWHAPVYVGVLAQGQSQRAVVIDGRSGAVSEPYSQSLTANFGAFRERLAG